MTNETREALVLLKAQLSASEEAALRFVLLRDALSRSASGSQSRRQQRSAASLQCARSQSGRARF
mgnify:CR=1 FL=1